MKLVARKDFANVPAVGIQNLEVVTHVPKGFRFSIGKGDALGDLSESEKQLVAQLVVSKAAIPDDGDKFNAAAIVKVDAEVKASKEAVANTPKPKTMEELVAAAVAKALVEAGAIKTK